MTLRFSKLRRLPLAFAHVALGGHYLVEALHTFHLLKPVLSLDNVLLLVLTVVLTMIAGHYVWEGGELVIETFTSGRQPPSDQSKHD